MYQFIETIRINQAIPENLALHQKRMQSTLADHKIDSEDIDLSEYLNKISFSKSEIIKCTITYSDRILKAKIVTYRKKEIKTIQCVEAESMDYQYKYADRSMINLLYEKKGTCQDILIVKNGLITDSSYCNIALLKDHVWYTPETPLLNGTQRQQLLSENVIKPKAIYSQEIKEYEQLALFNAMIPWNERIQISIDNIIR